MWSIGWLVWKVHQPIKCVIHDQPRETTHLSLVYIFFILFFSWLSLGLVIWPILGDPFVSQNLRSLCLSFSKTDSWLCIYHLFVWSNFNFLHNSQWITFPTKLCLILYYFCANLLHLLIMSLNISSLLPHNLYLQFCCVLSIPALI